MLRISNTIVFDNGPQFISDKLKQFVEWWDKTHITSSSRYPQGNREAKQAVQTVKGLMRKNINYHAALCVYHDTPVPEGYSPAELLFGSLLNYMSIHRDTRVDIQSEQS